MAYGERNAMIAGMNRYRICWLVALISLLSANLSPGQAAESPRSRDRAAMARIANPPLGLPAVPTPSDNPPTAEKIRLGRKLFLDRRLSHNGTLSCAMCHVPEQGFAVNEMATAVGKEGKSLRRNSPTLLNVAYMRSIFHDGRETSIENQAIAPLIAADEMANPSIGYLVQKIKALRDYDGLFEQGFGRGPTMETVGMAIASYERTLLSANSAFDRWYFGKEPAALGADAIRGFELFTGKAGCAACHTIEGRFALFMDHQFHDTSVGWYRAMVRADSEQPVRVRLAPGVFVDLDAAAVRSVGKPLPADLGRYEVTLDPADYWRYKTPSLRNVALTAPYMHDGSLRTLPEVVAFYDRGGHPHPGIDPRIRALHLSQIERDSLVAFLNSLTGDNAEELVRDARSEKIGNPQ